MKKITCTTVLLLSLFPLISLLLPSALLAAGATETPIIPLDEIQRGQKGYGLSVFAGTEPERFEVEIIGVQHHFKPELSYILAKLSGKDLEKIGIFRGMSGSPVYIDGRLAGAVAFSYQFSLDPVAGITPIEAMRDLGQVANREFETMTQATVAQATVRSTATTNGPRPEPMVTWEELVRREFEPEIFDRPLRQLPAFAAAGRSAVQSNAGRSAVQWSAGGFGEQSTSFLNRTLASLGGNSLAGNSLGGNSLAGMLPAASGVADSSVAKMDELVPGSSVAAVLVRGDLQIAAYGTVTDTHGDTVLSMGHPLYSLGPVRYPMATSEVITVFASRADSFKISNLGQVIGAFDQDREVGVHGRLGLAAPMIPMTVRMRGLAEREYHMEIVDLPLLIPNMIAVSAFGALETAAYASGPHGIDLEARFEIEGHDDLVVRQSFDTPQAGVESVLYLVSFGGFLASNSLADVQIKSVDATFHQVDRPRTATLVGAHADRLVARPGETVRLLLDLQAYRGARYQETATITVPATAPDGRFVVFIGDGTSMDGVRGTVERQAPETFEQALAYLRTFTPRNQLKIFGLLPRPGLAVAGDVLPQLPASMRAIFAGGGPVGTPLGLAIVLEKDQDIDRPIVGFQRVDLEIRRKTQ